MNDVVILGAARTPMGGFRGGLTSLSAPRLGAIAIQAALSRAGVDGKEVQEVYMGNVCQAGVGYVCKHTLHPYRILFRLIM